MTAHPNRLTPPSLLLAPPIDRLPPRKIRRAPLLLRRHSVRRRRRRLLPLLRRYYYSLALLFFSNLCLFLISWEYALNWIGRFCIVPTNASLRCADWCRKVFAVGNGVVYYESLTFFQFEPLQFGC